MKLLQSRLVHCVQTLLELKPVLQPACQTWLMGEFSILEDYLEKIKVMELCEEDICRLEHLTAAFLNEVKISRRHHLRPDQIQ